MSARPPERRLIGRFTTAASREVVWETPDGLEIETRDQYDVSRKAVLFEDVQLVTYHRQLGVVFFILNAVGMLFFLMMMSILMSMKENVAGAVFGLLGVPFVIAMAIRAVLKVDVVTVFGRRSKAVMHFSFKKQRARQVYGTICARVRQVHRQIEQQIAAEAAADVSPLETPPAPPFGPIESTNPFA
ncbi:MAG TPA: hypothetical protein VJ276_26335 [Thermoanaerobaculia bacterium]|nr:hypothetical protein [Thermoanaerobaculia bacterium]